MKQSNFLSLGMRDFLRGLAIAVLTPVIFIIQQSIDSGEWVFNWKNIGFAAIAGGVAYIAKNLFTSPDNSAEKIIGTRPKDRD